MDHEQAVNLLNNDIRVTTLVEWLLARYEKVDIDYKIATTFSLGMLCSGYEY